MAVPASAPGDSQATYKYWAFISYSHRDKVPGEWLHKSLEAYRIAKPLRDRNTPMGAVPARLSPVFRDREELAAAPDLGDRIEAALKQSRYLIVVCSPASAASPWVNKEITYFKSLGHEDRIFSLIVEGEPYASEQPGRAKEECFPAALRFRLAPDGRLSDTRAEPLAADLRDDKDGRQNALLKLIAGMLGVGFDDLRQRHLETRNAWLRKVVTASVALVLIFAGLAIYALRQQRLAEERSRIALSRQLAVQSGTLLQTNPDLPLLLSLEAMFARDTVEARRSLADALMVTGRPITFVRSPVKAAVESMAISPDGKTLVTAGRKARPVFWDLTTYPPQPQASDEQSSSSVNSMSISRDGKLLAVAQDDGVISLWDVALRQRVSEPLIPKQHFAIRAVEFGPRNQLAFGYSSDESFGAVRIVLWDLAVGRAVRTIETQADLGVSDLAFSPDGRALASSAVGGDTTLWDLATGQALQSDFLKDTGSVAFSPDGKWLASGSWQLTLRDTATFKPVAFNLPDAPAHIGDVQFSRDGSFLASISSNGNAVVWDLESRTPRETPFQLKMGSLNALVLSPDDRTMYVGGPDERLAMVRLDTAPLRKVVRTGAYLSDVRYSPSTGELIATDDAGTAHFWDASTRKPLRKSPAVKKSGASVFAISPDGETLALGDNKGRLSFLDAKTLKPLSEPAQVKADRVDRLAFSPDGLAVAVVGIDRDVVIWDVKRHERLQKPLVADAEYARDAIFSLDGSRVYTVGDGGEALEWDWRSGERIGSPMKLPAGADALALSPDGSLLAVGGYDHQVTLWDITQRQIVGVPLVAHTNFVRTVEFSPRGEFLASGGDDGAVILWDVKSRLPIAEFRHGASVLSGDGTARTPRAVNHVSFSPDGLTLAADGPENDILLWDVDVNSWQRQACQRINRNLSVEEWQRYIADTQPRETCPGGLPRLTRAD
ncbi:TIR domain-containing protein [Cupriavidus necator]|uniref:toll/interleukin-1 receptor domain-containing protein n=1 Tax=Cupriavidus necator TaxID=106590 RepID=UPI0039C1821F